MSSSSGLTISWEWEPAAGVKAPELAGTFARLEFKVGQDFITLVEDRVSSSSRRAIHVSLYPLAEWIAYNWWFLQAHSRPVLDVRSRDTRHSVRSSADGFSWPDLYIMPEGTRTRLSWRRALGIDPSSNFDIDLFVKGLTRPAKERRIQAAGRGGRSTTNVVILSRRYARTSQRFTLAGAFWHIVANDQSEFLVTASYTEAQKIERGFAAELLAPAQGISDALKSTLADVQEEDLTEIAEQYQRETALTDCRNCVRAGQAICQGPLIQFLVSMMSPTLLSNISYTISC